MTKIKLCGIRRDEDIEYVNELCPDYIGFVFVKDRKRYVTPEKAEELRKKLDDKIIPVGVFVDEEIDNIVSLVIDKVIDMIQLHGSEDNEYIKRLKEETDVPVIQAFQIKTAGDIERAKQSDADYILLDSGTGTGQTFDHALIKNIGRPFFLAGGLDPENVSEAIAKFAPYAVDASSSLETDGCKDKNKMTAFVNSVRTNIS